MVSAPMPAMRQRPMVRRPHRPRRPGESSGPREEIKPLKQISERFDSLADKAGLTHVELQPSRALSDFMEQFNSYIEATQTRIEVLNQEHENLQMSSKLLTYRNNRIDTILQNFPDAIVVIDEVVARRAFRAQVGRQQAEQQLQRQLAGPASHGRILVLEHHVVKSGLLVDGSRPAKGHVGPGDILQLECDVLHDVSHPRTLFFPQTPDETAGLLVGTAVLVQARQVIQQRLDERKKTFLSTFFISYPECSVYFIFATGHF